MGEENRGLRSDQEPLPFHVYECWEKEDGVVRVGAFMRVGGVSIFGGV